MPTITVRKHNQGGLDRSAEPAAIADGAYVTLKNRVVRRDVLEGRPGRTRHLTRIGPGNLPVTGLARMLRGQSPYSQGPRDGSAAVNDPAYGSVDWTRLTDPLDDSAPTLENGAMAQVGGFQHSKLLKITGFGFSLPASADIVGIEVMVRRRSSIGVGGSGNQRAVDARIWLVWAGVAETDPARSKHRTDLWPQTAGEVVYGGRADLWGATPTPANINHAGFGVAIAARINPQFEGITSHLAVARVHYVTVTIYYRPDQDIPDQTLAFVSSTLYSDRTGAWAGVNGANPLLADAPLDVLFWRGNAYIQDGANGPYVYDGTTFSVWTGTPNPPPIGRYMLFDVERIYIAHLASDPNALAIGTLNRDDDFPTVGQPGGDGGTLMFVGRDDGDHITGVGRLGTTKFIFKRRSTYRLLGDSAETWDLGPKPFFPVGCISHRTIADCGNELVWTDGRRVYSYGPQGLDFNFGKPVEKLLEQTPLEQLVHACAVFWNGYYLLWVAPTVVVAFDFTIRAWVGPWETLPARVAIVDRNEDLVWFGSSLAGDVWRLTGETDDGTEIAWEAESKHYGLAEARLARPRQFFITADGEVGTLDVEILASGGPGQAGVRSILRTFVFSGSGPVTLARPLSLGADGVYLGVRLRGTHGRGKVYEYGLRADPLRARW